MWARFGGNGHGMVGQAQDGVGCHRIEEMDVGHAGSGCGMGEMDGTSTTKE